MGRTKERDTNTKISCRESVGFLHMSDSVIHTYLALGVMGAVLIGAVLLERYLVQNDYVSATKLLSDGIHYGVRIGEWDSSAMYLFEL